MNQSKIIKKGEKKKKEKKDGIHLLSRIYSSTLLAVPITYNINLSFKGLMCLIKFMKQFLKF